MKRLIIVLFIIVFALTGAAEGNLGHADPYNLALLWLKQEYSYKNPQNVNMALESMNQAPAGKYYKQYVSWLTAVSMIHQAYYTKTELDSLLAGENTDGILGLTKDIAEIDMKLLSDARVWLSALKDDKGFEDDLKDNQLPAAEEIDRYITGLFNEKRGNITGAIDAFSGISDLFDANRRLIALTLGNQADICREGRRLLDEKLYWQAYLEYKKLDEYYWSEQDERFAYELADEALKLHRSVHRFSPATCTEAETCPECGDTQGKPMGHDWKAATCTEPKTCLRCGEKEGKPLGHAFKGVTCTDPGVCSRCGAKGTKLAEHDWKRAACTVPETCRICGATRGSALGHNWQPATYDRPETCSRCGATRGEKLKKTKPEVGDYVLFGSYEQDNNAKNGKEPIEWRVLDIQGSKALLLSRYALDNRKYNEQRAYVTWETCSLRTWLNKEFINAAFANDEQTAILTTEVNNGADQCYSKWGEVDSGRNTRDKVFLLSYKEAYHYVYAGSLSELAVVSPTQYAIAQGANVTRKRYERDVCDWFLRSPGVSQAQVSTVDDSGLISRDYVDSRFAALRPAVWVNMDSGKLILK